MTICVVEDNDGDFILLEDLLIEIYRTITIKRFQTFNAFSIAIDEPGFECDIILLDLHLPDKNGFDLVKDMIETARQIPILILTGYVDQPLAKKSLKIGVYDFLIKDEVNIGFLHKSIEFALSRKAFVGYIETQNTKLKEIAWTQSHLVRAPLARILGIIHVIENTTPVEGELKFWLEQLKISSEELDIEIREIVEKTNMLDFDKR